MKQVESASSQYSGERSAVWDEPRWLTDSEQELLDLLGLAILAPSVTRTQDVRSIADGETVDPGSGLRIDDEQPGGLDEDLLDGSVLPLPFSLRKKI